MRYANRAACASLGYAREELLTLTLAEVSANCTDEAFLGSFLRRVATEGELVHDGRHRRRDGSVVPVEVRARMSEVDGEPCILAVVRELSDEDRADRELLFRQLTEASKLATLGTLTAGIAHELNNPLTTVLGYAEQLAEVHADEPVRRQARIILRSARRIAGIVEHLRSYGHRARLQDWGPVDVGGVVRSAAQLLQRQLVYRNVDLELDLHPVPPVHGDVAALESVVQNLLSNSLDAFDELQETRARKVRIEVRATGQRVWLTYSDNAGGMEPDVTARVFEPFFTTRPAGRGTGLGLAVAFAVVERHGGRLGVRSTPGEGTTFTLQLLAGDGGGTSTGSPPVDRPRVLVIDDEVAICGLLSEVLAPAFAVTGCDRPERALELLELEEWDLVLCDLRMPGLSGLDVLQWLATHHPELPALVISGHAQADDQVQAALEAGARGIIAKPFPPREVLIATLRQALG